MIAWRQNYNHPVVKVVSIGAIVAKDMIASDVNVKLVVLKPCLLQKIHIQTFAFIEGMRCLNLVVCRGWLLSLLPSLSIINHQKPWAFCVQCVLISRHLSGRSALTRVMAQQCGGAATMRLFTKVLIAWNSSLSRLGLVRGGGIINRIIVIIKICNNFNIRRVIGVVWQAIITHIVSRGHRGFKIIPVLCIIIAASRCC
jgi:hypothetical protein